MGRMNSIFGIPIDGFSLEETLRRIRESQTPLWIVTANPEILLAARRDPAYAETLRRADLRLVDGVGVWILLRLRGHRTTRVTGVALAETLIQKCVQRNWKVAFIGGAQGIAHTAAEETRKLYPTLTIHAEHGGNVSSEGLDDDSGAHARMRLTQFAPDILCVALGHPKQERWIEKHWTEFPRVKVIIGVGGTLDYWAGTKKRAPVWMRAIGLEWLWRVIREPRRWKRIWNAIAVFPILAFWDTMG